LKQLSPNHSMGQELGLYRYQCIVHTVTNTRKNIWGGKLSSRTTTYKDHITQTIYVLYATPKQKMIEILAHELGHYFIDTHRIGLKKGILEPHPSLINRKQFNSIEREADYFASCLLMPESRFNQDIFKKKFNFQLIDSLCTQYKVSRTACAFRFAQIGNHPIMIIYAERGVVKWKLESDDFPYKWLLNDRTVPTNTVMGEYFLQSNTQDIYKTEQVWAMDWFNYVKDRDTERPFYEHCIPYKDKALSIIWED